MEKNSPLKASDLRLGNLVFTVDRPGQLRVFDTFDMEELIQVVRGESDSFRKYYGVPISDILLLDAGFKRGTSKNEDIFFFKLNVIKAPFGKLGEVSFILLQQKHNWLIGHPCVPTADPLAWEGGPAITSKEIHYIHEIQNFSHAFYGIDLKFTLV